MTKLSYTAAEIAVLSAFNADTMPDNVRAKLDELNRITTVLTDAKNVQENAQTEKGNAWDAIKAVAFAVSDATSTAPAVKEMIFNSVMHEYVDADKASAKASLKSYVSTARNMLLKLEGAVSRQVLSEASYKAVRELLAPAPTEGAAVIKKINEQLRYVERNAFKKKDSEEAKLALVILNELLETTTTLYNQYKGANDSESAAATLSRELHDMKPEAPTAPTEVVINRRSEAVAATA